MTLSKINPTYRNLNSTNQSLGVHVLVADVNPIIDEVNSQETRIDDLEADKQNLVPRVQSVVSAATVTPTDEDDLVVVTALAAACQFLNPTGSPVQGQAMILRIKDDATPRLLTYDTQYRAIGITLPTTTVASKITYIGMVYNSTETKWDCISTVTEA